MNENALVRRLCCQLISKLLAGLPSETDLSEELFEQLSEAVVDRMVDRAPAVRQAAARAAWRLQDPSNLGCPVSTALAVVAAQDVHSGCRQAAIDTIHIPTPIGTPAVISRLADSSELVRRAALKRLSARLDGSGISVRVLTPEHIREVLARVFCEPSSKLRQSYGQLLIVQKWLDDDCRGDICSFLSLINVDTCKDLGRRFIHFVAFSEPNRLEKVASTFSVPAFSSTGGTSVSLSIERVFAWSSLLELALTFKQNELFSNLLPGCSDDADNKFNDAFCLYVQQYFEKLFDDPPTDAVDFHTVVFIGEHLLKVFKYFTKSVESEEDKNKILKLITDLLNRNVVLVHFMEDLTKIWCDLLGNGVTAVSRTCAVVSEALDPEKMVHETTQKQKVWEDENVTRAVEIKVAELRIQLSEMRDQLDDLVQEQRYEEAAVCREKITELRDRLAEATAEKMNAPKAGSTSIVESSAQCSDMALCTQQLAKQRQTGKTTL